MLQKPSVSSVCVCVRAHACVYTRVYVHVGKSTRGIIQMFIAALDYFQFLSVAISSINFGAFV